MQRWTIRETTSQWKRSGAAPLDLRREFALGFCYCTTSVMGMV